MNKESTTTIYNCLGMAFWTKRKCLRCRNWLKTTKLPTFF